jgi:hypothetical protein
MIRAMIVLETAGIAPSGAIVSVGAVKWDEGSDPTAGFTEFYQRVSLASSQRAGGQLDADVLLWWTRQPDAVRQEAFTGTVDVCDALVALNAFLGGCGEVWAAPALDLLNLESVCRGLAKPWDRSMIRCWSTLKKAMKVTDEPDPTYGALTDARNRAISLRKVLAALP